MSEPGRKAPSLPTWSAAAAAATAGLAIAIAGVIVDLDVLVIAGVVLAVLAGLVMLVYGEKTADELSKGPRSR